MKHLDPRSPLVFSTLALGRRPGSMLEVSREVECAEPIGTDVIEVPAREPLDVEVRLESVLEGVLATGSVRATAVGACVRCLDQVSVDVDGTFQELFAYPERAARGRKVGATDEETQEYEVQDDLINLEPVLVDAVVPSLPFQPVCREDCPGLCPQCGFRLADDPAHAHELLDPRWSALAGLAGDADAADPTEKRN
ncbi:YceD family protein [Nostocoides veronense]